MNSSTPETDDVALLRRYAHGGDEQAFADLVRRHIDLVYSAALRRLEGDIPRAQEVAQSVFAELARKSGALTGHPLLPGWLYRTSCRMAADHHRRQCRRQRREQLMPHPPEPVPDNGPDWDALSPILDDAMLELPVQDRNLVLLRFFERRDFGALGAASGLSEDAARMRVSRALDRLRTVLAHRGITSTAAALAGVLTARAVAAAPETLARTAAHAALKAGRELRAAPWKTGWIAAHWKACVLGGAAAALMTVVIRTGEVRMLDQLLMDPDPALVELASDALSHIRKETAKPVFTFEELEPLFQAMAATLSPGEYAVAMRDLRRSLEDYWKMIGTGSGAVTLVPAMFVQGLPVGPMHENPAAYRAMVAALRRIDPRIPVPTPAP